MEPWERNAENSTARGRLVAASAQSCERRPGPREQLQDNLQGTVMDQAATRDSDRSPERCCSTSHPPGCVEGPWSWSQSVSFYSSTGSSRRAGPHPTPPLHACPSPRWTEPALSGCPPATQPADMGTRRAAPLRWAILGLLMLRGHNSQPMTTPTSQGTLSSQSLVTEPTSPTTGNKSSSEPGTPKLLLSSTRTPAPTQKASPGPLVSSKAGTPRASTEDGHALSLLGLTQSQPQRSTSELESSQNATPNAITMSLRTRGDLTILPSPTSETVLTVAAFGVISFIVILVVVVIVLVAVVSLRFKCRKNKDAEDPQKPGSSGLSESCSTANGEKHSITLISMKNINMNNSKACPSAEKVL
ncbi:endothelial cell-specific chemotaxis regulator isoform X1 [Cavia porcellus]|uniref:endothelial cell-specific chemotaxis regulator isoform X1 n=1 Tax=Cavia porcellus TaxID=10141 RepID=UPI000661C0FD|nr:endothelial cell-specific chemotaxis regulator [Cavia porcellus]